jgi:hypothetical protein
MNLFDMFESGKKQDIEEACWKGYHKEGMKTMFGKRYPNCVKNKNESLETYVNKGECPGCGGAMVSEEQINEKQDACYHKVKSRYKVWPSAYASGALVQCRKKGANNWGNKSEGALNEFAPGSDDGNNGEEDTLLKYAKLWYNGDLETQQQVEKLLDRMGWEIGEIESEEGGAFVVQPGDEHGRSYIGWTAADLIEEQLDENLRQWFSDKWVRFGPDGKIRGDCARGDSSEGKPKCLPQSKAHALGKKGRASAAARKRREDPNPERSGKAINVNTKKKTSEGVAEGVNDYLWHGSKSQHDILYPQQANDTGGKEESNKNAIYATPNAKVAIAMGLTTPGSDTGMFPNDPQMVLFKGGIRKGEMIYLHKVPKDLFIKHNNREWYSKPDVKEITPIEIKKIPVDKYLNLIRTATPQDLELQKKYMKKQGVAEGSNDTIYPNAEVIKSKNGKPIGEIYQDGNSWGAFHYRADRGYDFIDSREEAIEALRDLHQETGRSRPDYTIKGVAEGNDDHIWGPQGNFAGDRIVNLGGVTMKTVEVGDTVKYFGQKAKVVAMSKDRKHSRINILSDFGGTTRDVLTSDLKQLGQGVAEGYEPGDKITWYHSNHHPEIEGTVVGWKDGHLIVKSIDPQPRNTEKTVAKYRVPKNNILSHDKQGVAEVSDATLTSYLTKLDKDNLKHRMDPTKRSDTKRMKSGPNFVKAFTKLDNRKQGVAEATGDERFDSMMGKITGGAGARPGVDSLNKSLAARTGSDPETALAKWGQEFIKWLEDICRNFSRQGVDRFNKLKKLSEFEDGGETMAYWLIEVAKQTKTSGITLADIQEFSSEFNTHGMWAWQMFPMAWSQNEWQDYKDQWTGPNGYIANLGQGVAEEKIQEIQRKPDDPVGYSTDNRIVKSSDLKGLKMIPGSNRLGYSFGPMVTAFTGATHGIHLYDIKNRRLVGYLALAKSAFPLPKSYRVANVNIDDDYRGQGLGQTLYGIAIKLLGLTIEADDTQTAASRRMWVALSQIPGVEINGYAKIWADEWDKRDTPNEIYDDSELRVIRALIKAGGEELGRSHSSVYVSFPVGSNADKSELQSIQKGLAIYSRLHPEDGGTDNGLYARWGGQVREQGVAESSNKKQEATRRIQKMLNDKFDANLDVDGVLGPLTLKSINKFMPNAKVGPAEDPNKTTAVQGKKVKNKDTDQNQLAEKWSQKYKSSINCSNPKGFSQRAHCDGKNKNEDVTETAEYNYSNINDDDWYEFNSEGNVVRQSGPRRYELPFGSNKTIKLPNGNIAAKGMTAKRLKLFKNLSESREYYNVMCTDAKSLRQDFNMSKDRHGWFLKEGSTSKQKLDVYRAFGSPKLKEYDLSAFSGGTQTKGEDNVISPVGSQTRAQYKK